MGNDNDFKEEVHRFVKYTQDNFDERARKLVRTGVLCLVLGFCVIVYFSLNYMDMTNYIKELKEVSIKDCPEIINYYSALKIIKSITLSGIVVGFCIFMFGLSKTLFHEAMVLLNRRHSLRFGQMYIDLKGKDVELKDLISAFQWDSIYSSAFKKLLPEKNIPNPTKELINLMKMYLSSKDDQKEELKEK